MPIRHVVKQGEGLSSIAEKYGFAPWTIWDHPANAELKKLRKSADVLFPGDVVHVPDLNAGARAASTDRRMCSDGSECRRRCGCAS